VTAKGFWRVFAPTSAPLEPIEAVAADGFADELRRAATSAYLLLKETDPVRTRSQAVEDARRLFRADTVRLFEPGDAGELELTARSGIEHLPETARAFEPVLARRALETRRSLISDHPKLDEDLRALASRCRRERIVVQLLVLNANGETLGVAAVHWIGRERPGPEERSGAYLFWDLAGLAVAIANERAHLQSLAFVDELTGLPNQRALVRELEACLASGAPVSILYLDFDGMRETNNTLGYDAGDRLIAHVARGLGRGLAEAELAARVHRAGDEFACLLRPDADGSARAAALESHLDELALPDEYRPLYGGASVGWATSEPGDTPEALLARAARRMRLRKDQRRPG